MKLSRPASLFLELERYSGRAWLIPPPTRAQMRETLALDPEENDTAPPPLAEVDARVALQLEVLTRGAVEVDPHTHRPLADNGVASGFPLTQLTGEEERAILRALVNLHYGNDPVAAEALQQALKKKAFQVARASSPASTPNHEPSPSISAAR